MKKTALVFIVCLSLVGCNATKEIEHTLKQTLNLTSTGGGRDISLQNENGISKDMEDQACGNISYEKRTICRIQVHLNSLNYPAGTPDGIAGQGTTTAIHQYQMRNKIQPVDGKPSYALLTQLRKDNLKGASPIQTGLYSAAVCGTLARFMRKDMAAWALACGAGGAVLQEMANQGREEYAMRYYEIKDENERTEKEIDDIAKQAQNNEQMAHDYEKEVQLLIMEEKDNNEFVAKAKILRMKLAEQERLSRDARREAEIKIAILESKIKDVNEILVQKPNEEEFQKTLAVLEKQKAKLVDAVKTSNGIEKELLAQKDTLDREIVDNS